MSIKEENYTQNLTLSILSKGVSGAGKTIASCGTLFRPVYVFDLDQRFNSVINYYLKKDGNWKGIEFDTFTIGDDFKKLDRQMDSIEASNNYKTVVIASLTSYIHIVLGHVLGFKAREGKGKKVADINVNSLEDYNVEDAALIFELIGFLKRLQARGTNVILECHLTPVDYRALDGSVTTKLEILTKGKKAPAQIPGYFDEVYYFTKEHTGIVAGMGSPEFKMKTSDILVDAKSSRGIEGFTWTNQDFSQLLMRQVK